MTTEILGVGLAMSLAGGVYCKLDNKDLELELLKKDAIIQQLENDKQNLNSSIEEQNAAIENIQIDVAKAVDEYNKAIPLIADKVLEKYVRDVNLTRGNCNDANKLNANLDGITL